MEDTHKFGDNMKILLAFTIGFIGFQLLFHLVIKPNNIVLEPVTTECKADSLQNVIGNLQSDIKILEEGFDSREHRYEDVISDYEMGLSYLKYYHPSAYKDFHRIVGMRERYSHELERENIELLKLEKWN
jgi:hypothetical protein